MSNDTSRPPGADESASSDRLREQFRELSELSSRLVRELDPEAVLPEILTTARRVTGAEAGTLYLRDGDALVFAVAQNDRRGGPKDAGELPDIRLPLDESSLAGLSARDRRVLEIPDARSHPSLNRQSQDAFSYEVVSVLVVPLVDHADEVTGVLQLLNALDEEGDVVPFSADSAWLARLFAGHAATAIEIARLHAELRDVFDALVRYSAQAIDARDASTAGHSSRVAAYSRRIAEEMGGFSDAELREIRFAGIFHDIGKIGVRERVLTKGDKLEPEGLQAVCERFAAAQEALLRRGGEEARADAEHLEEELGLVRKLNAPGWVDDDELARLGALAARTWTDWRGTERPLLTEDEHEKLSVRKGNLTPAERADIERHVSLSHKFLKQLPFPAELANLPEIVWSHHEKIDGSGYPRGLAGEEIPRAARILAVVDVFDALTATDRPYKKAMSAGRALEILEHETELGSWDADVVAAMRRLVDAGKLVPQRMIDRPDDEPLDLSKETWKR